MPLIMLFQSQKAQTRLVQQVDFTDLPHGIYSKNNYNKI